MNRKEYMSADTLTNGAYDGSKGYDNHQAYFAQFATPEVTRTLLQFIGGERLLASRDIHLNDISLNLWDGLPFLDGMKRKAQELGDNLSLGTKVCAYKAAARAWLKANGGLPCWRVRYEYRRMSGDPQHLLYSYAIGSDRESALVAFRAANPGTVCHEIIERERLDA